MKRYEYDLIPSSMSPTDLVKQLNARSMDGWRPKFVIWGETKDPAILMEREHGKPE